MEKEKVIRTRDILKAGKNLPVRIMTTSSNVCIDESSITQFTIWDDDAGMLYCYKLIDLQSDSVPSNGEQAISMIAMNYENIEAMEAPVLPLSMLDASLSAIEASGRAISEDMKKRIKTTYNEILHPYRYRLGSTDINNILGPDAVNDKDDYYQNKFTTVFNPKP